MEYLQEYNELALRAFVNQVHSSERFGGGWLGSLDGELAAVVLRLRRVGVWEESIDRLIAGYKRHVSAFFGAESRCASSFITGPAKFPVRQQQKRRATAEKRRIEMNDYLARAERMLTRAAIRAEKRENGITPLVEAQRNLNRRVQEHAMMKAANVAIRKGKTFEEQEANLLDLGYSPVEATRLLKPAQSWHRQGYQGWQLSNNNAQIVRLRGRVAELKQKEAVAEKQAEQSGPARHDFEGGYVELNYGDDRVRIVHDAKPDEATRTSLKRNGFKWSSYNGAWQRQITNAAIYAAEQLTGVALKQYYQSRS